MNADTITRALDTAIRLPGALQLQLVAENRATLFGREDRELPGLQDLGLRIPTEQQLLTLFESMNEAAGLLEGCSSCFVAGTAVEVEDLRGYLTKAARICQEAPAAAFFVGDTDKERRDRWYSISTTFTKWARAVEGCRPSELAATQPASGQETGQIAASTPAPAPSSIHHLETSKTKEEQRRIFQGLAARGFIAGTDAGGASMLQPFLNAFDPAAPEQGRIIWTGTSSKAGSRGTPSPRQALDFVALMAGGIQCITPSFGRLVFPAIFPGLQCSDDARQTFAKLWNRGGGSEYHGEIRRIINDG